LAFDIPWIQRLWRFYRFISDFVIFFAPYTRANLFSRVIKYLFHGFCCVFYCIGILI